MQTVIRADMYKAHCGLSLPGAENPDLLPTITRERKLVQISCFAQRSSLCACFLKKCNVFVYSQAIKVSLRRS